MLLITLTVLITPIIPLVWVIDDYNKMIIETKPKPWTHSINM